MLKKYHNANNLNVRKYEYEKILNKYLESKYNIDGLESDYNIDNIVQIRLNNGWFDQNKQKLEKQYERKLEEKRKKELEEKKKQELQNKKRREKEEKILNQISKLVWKKRVNKSITIYKAVYEDGKNLKLCYVTNKDSKKIKYRNEFIYDNHPFSYIKYDIDNVVRDIEKTNPKSHKKKNVVNDKKYVEVNKKQESLQKRKVVNKKMNAINQKIKEEEFQQIYKARIKKISEDYGINDNNISGVIDKIRGNCSYCKDNKCSRIGNCTPYEKKCIYYYHFISKILEISRENNKSLGTINRTYKIEDIKSKGKTITDKNSENCYKIGLKDFVVKGNVFQCMHKKHKIDNVVAMINIDNDGKRIQEKISAGYCSQCRVYFIMDSTYQTLKKKGIILCRISDEKSYYKGGFVNGMHLAQESILMQYGYNVSQTAGLSELKRQKILAVIIDNEVLSKGEIISYLDFFINQRKSSSKMGIAISKWEADREFVENYKIGHYTQFGVKAIYRK